MNENLEHLQQLVSDIHALIDLNNKPLDKKSLNCVASAEYCYKEDDAGALIKKLELIKERLSQQHLPMEDFSYPGDIKFSQLKSLIPVVENEQRYPIYILFDAEMIKDYSHANDDELKAIANFFSHPHFCGPAGKSGIKYFKDEKPACFININGSNFKGEITHELKLILNNASRILFYSLKPLESGPVILIASHFVSGGLHASHAKKKMTFIANDLVTAVKDNGIAKTLATQGLFAKVPRPINEEKQTMTHSLKMAA